MSKMTPHITTLEPEDGLKVTIHPASPDSVSRVMTSSEESPDGRSNWVWLRLPNGDLILGVFPQGDTYLDCERDAQFPAVQSRPRAAARDPSPGNPAPGVGQMKQPGATINGRTITLGNDTREGDAVGPFLIHKGFGYNWQLWAITVPSGSSLGHYRTRTAAKRAAKIVLATCPDLDWRAMRPGDELPEPIRVRLLAAVRDTVTCYA